MVVEDVKMKAVFSGWKVSGLTDKSIPGPFEIEIRRSDSKSGYVPYLLPTNQKFGKMNTRKIEDACIEVSSLFEKVVEDWKKA